MTVADALRVCTLAALVIVAGQVQVQAQEEVEITTQRLSDTVSVLFGQGGNIGVSSLLLTTSSPSTPMKYARPSPRSATSRYGT